MHLAETLRVCRQEEESIYDVYTGGEGFGSVRMPGYPIF